MPKPDPYVGPRALTESNKIYGRDWERAELRDLLLARGVVLMHSPSGAGKTSLVQAGLIPLLKPRGIEILGPIRPGLPATGIPALRSQTRYGLSMLAQLDEHLDANELSQLTLSEFMTRRNATETASRCLLILDQFEEVLTLDPTDLAEKRAFFEELGKALRILDGMVLFCIRDDYVGALEPYLNYLPSRLSTRFRLDLLGQRAAMEAIQKPALEAGVRFEPSAAKHIWQSLSEVLVPAANGKVERKPGPYLEAVQLQVVCKQLWDAPRPNPERITRRDVEQLGQVNEALGRFYSDAIQAAAAKGGVPERQLREWFSGRLITQGLRGQVMEGSDAMEGMPAASLRELVNAYVLREEWRRGIRWYEVAHDRLVEPIDSDNKKWFDSHMTALARLTNGWYESGQSADLLLTLEELAKAKPESLREKAFVRASEMARHAERRTNLAITGWGVVFAPDTDPLVREALEPLLALRRAAARERYREYSSLSYTSQSGYRSDMTAEEFLSRQGATPGLPDYARVPYYLLIVGSPESIPFEFQYGLSVYHAVGRLDFDSPADYEVYARSVVFCERGDFSLARRLFVFAPKHEFDRATEASARAVAYPMVERFRQSHPDWVIQTALGADATKARLSDAIGGPESALAVCAIAHGVEHPKGNPRQHAETGALVCQGWDRRSPLNRDYYYGAQDVGDEARLLGTVACLVAASTAGVSKYDEFVATDPPRELADAPFISALPKRLLSHPNGSALAAIAHVDRNWLASLSPDANQSTGLIETVLASLLNGHTVGSAMTALTQRTSFLYSVLADYYRTHRAAPDDAKQRLRLITTLDVRNYVIIGDPATRLPITAAAAAPERPVLPKVSAPTVTRAPEAAKEQETVPEIVFNGIDAATGTLSIPPLTAREVGAILRGGSLDAERRDWLRSRYAATAGERPEAP